LSAKNKDVIARDTIAATMAPSISKAS